MGVSAVVVTYNRLNLLKECLANLLKQTYRLDYIFVINNNSSDGTKEYLDNLHNSHIVPENLHHNYGGAGGFSLGVKLAFQHSNSDFIWIMDDDTMPTKTALQNLINCANSLNNNFGFLCSNVRWWKNNDPCNIPNVANDWTRYIDKGLIKVRTSTFVSVLFPRHVVQQVGLPIGDMFIWGDDTEYTTRISRKYNSFFVHNSIVLHKSAVNDDTETIFNVVRRRMSFYKCMYRNLLYIDRKYYSFKRTVRDVLNFLFTFIEIPFKSKNHRLLRMDVTLTGIIKGLCFNPKVKWPTK